MKKSATLLADHFRRMRAAYIVLGIALVPTFFAFAKVWQGTREHDAARFKSVTEMTRGAIAQRIADYSDELYAVRGLFAASESVQPSEWNRFLQNLDVPRRQPGVLAIGYAAKVSSGETRRFLAEPRMAGASGSANEPDVPRKVQFPVVYLTNFESSAAASAGFDLAADADRLNVLEQAGAAGTPVAMRDANPKWLKSDSTNSAVFLYLPVYRTEAHRSTAEERASALQGFVFCAFAPDRMIEELPPQPGASSVKLWVFDGPQTSQESLIYGPTDFSEFKDRKRADDYRGEMPLSVLDQTWTLCFAPEPRFETESQRYLAWLTLAGGLAVSILLFGIAWVQARARTLAEQGANELQRSEAALAAEKERLTVTLQSLAEGVITTNDSGVIIGANPAAETLLDLEESAVGRPLKDVFCAAQEHSRKPFPDLVERVLRTSQTATPDEAAVVTRRDGENRTLTCSAAPVRNQSGRVFGAVLVFRDVTRRRKTEEEMLRESKLESVGLLAGGIAHDFNNILTGILGNISLARMFSHSTEKMLERVTGLEKSAMRAKDLTQQLLTFAKGGSPIRRPMQLQALVKDACQFALRGSNVQCEFALAADTHTVEIDEGQFRQIVNHLVINAVQAMPAGGTIEVKLENVEITDGFLPPLPAGNYVKLSIKDHGEGIPPENLPRIFEPYFSTRKGGSGLGLATAYSVVRKHDGQIRVESKVGEGTTFLIYLPASVRKPVETSDSSQTDFFGQGRLLLMDDEADILAVGSEMLRAYGYEVETAKDGADAIARYIAAKDAGQPFTAVIMDLTVPNGMGGREAMRGLKEVDPDVKGIVSSGYSFDPVMGNYREFGFCGIIPKPYRAEDLGRVLMEVLGAQPAGAK